MSLLLNMVLVAGMILLSALAVQYLLLADSWKFIVADSWKLLD